MAGESGTVNANGEDARPTWERCRCDQYGRCLTDCPSAGLPRPNPTAYYDRRSGQWVQR
jgi:hypothetical protein